MSWIEEVLMEHGPKVKLMSQSGHQHWGFQPGSVYTIKKREGGRYAFFGDFGGNPGMGDASPLCNWGNWEFVKALPVQLENK